MRSAEMRRPASLGGPPGMPVTWLARCWGSAITLPGPNSKPARPGGQPAPARCLAIFPGISSALR